MTQDLPENLKSALLRGTLDRRQFMTHAIAAGVTVTAASAFADKVEAATPKKGGALTVGLAHGATSDTLDPGLYENNFTTSLSFGFNGYLTEVGPDGSLQPSIAESWEATADAATWTFKLRKGVEFHDGRPVTAQDVVTSLNHHRGEDSTSAAKPLFSSVTDIKAEGKDTVVVSLSGGNADFPFYMIDYHVVIQPDKDGKMDWQPGVGCGAYKLDHYDAGVSAELSRNENHWTDAVGHFDHVQILSLIDTNARTSAIVSGDVDVIDRIDLKTAGLLGRKSGVTIHNVAGTQQYTFPMRTDTSPYDDVNVRRAIKHSVNRQELVDKVLFGYGVVGNDHPIGPGMPFRNDDLPQTPYDPDKAKHFLKKAGYSSLKLQLSAADAAFAGAVDAAVLIQNSAKASGLDIEVVREPNDGYWGDVWLNKPWCACYWGGRPVADMILSTAYAAEAPWNDSFWKHDRFNELLVAARAELDQERRRRMYYEIQTIINDEGGVLIPMFASYVFATSDKVGVPEKMASNWDMDGARWMERWWKV